MLLPKIALHGASPIFFTLLLLEQATVLAHPLHFADTVYLDRNGDEIKRIRDPKTNKTFIVKTTQTTDSLYGTSQMETDNVQRGISNPISVKEAGKTEQLIREGRFQEAQQTGNLVKLNPLSERQEDGKLMQQDNGAGGEEDGNNREYASVIYRTLGKNREGNRIEMRGAVSSPQAAGGEIFIPSWESVISCSHSHPSGNKVTGNSESRFDPQAPSLGDIHAVRPGQVSVVFGRATDKVYLYDSSGVIAVLPTKAYISL